ncbi:sensor histidine kinase [Leucobacter albus]|uniref:histidine kinase n=1 Tax=Leucobacter albus TaxID=272210 RepID=A0ABW3TRT4_9MICO
MAFISAPTDAVPAAARPHSGSAPRSGAWTRLTSPAMVGRDLGYVLPGFFISLFAFALLIPLAAIGLSTLIIWVGAVILPFALILATKFAELSRLRARWWGADVQTPNYRPQAPGLGGLARVMQDPRRWLDLAFETLVAFPVRCVTFSIGIGWLSAALGGTTWMLWSWSLPKNDSVFPGNMLQAVSGGAIPAEAAYSRTAEALTYTAFGLVALALLPLVVRALAVIDVALTRAGLGAAPHGPLTGHTASAPASMVPSAADGQQPASQSIPTGWSWILVGFAAVATLAVTWPLLSALYGMHPAISMIFGLGQATILPLALRQPAVAIALGALTPAAAALVTATPAGLPWPWPITMLIVQALLVFLLGLRSHWRWVLAAWALPQLAVIAAVVIAGAAFTPGTITSLVVCSSISLGLGLVGIVAQALLEDRGALREERRHSAELDAKQRELSERNLVARELHDVVAHSMSVVSIQANTAKYRIPGLGAEAEAEFEAIAQSSRQALGEMRGLLATLRDSDGTAPLAPQPTLADLPALIESSRQSGATITYQATGFDTAPSPAVPASTALTAYRVAQEALSNAIRHAPGSAIDVAAQLSGSAVTISVRNGAASAPAGPSAGSGMGLAGLGERVAALGGTFEAGADGDGFAVRATLPL